MSYYEFVPVSSTQRTSTSPESRLKLKNVYSIEFTFEAKTHVHVSSGIKKLIKKGNRYEILLQQYRNSSGLPVVPGSSLKGVVSTNFLALCGDAEMTANLFGASRIKAVISKVFFSDMCPQKDDVVEVEVLRQWRPNRRKGRHVKFYVRKPPRTANYGLLECIPAGSVLRGKVTAYNLSKFELGGLLMSMGFGIDGAVFKIGYGKPQGFGQMIPVEAKILEVKPDDLKFKKYEVDSQQYIQVFKSKFDDRISKFGKIIFAGV